MLRRTALLLALAVATPAFAHTGAGTVHGFSAGMLHPLLGLDHLLAMSAVGLWAGLIGGRALWVWPTAFVAVMTIGAVVGMSGADLPGIETAIALSVVVLGAAVALRLPAPLVAGAAVCGIFAIAHGHAHGAELPDGAGAVSYMTGFVLATAALHLSGIGLGNGLARIDGNWLPRLAGGAVAATGLVLLLG